MYSLLLLGISAAFLTDLASAQCDLQAAMKCFQTQSGVTTDTAASCSRIQKAMTCIAPFMESCKSDETFQKSLSTLTSLEPMCAGGDQCSVRFQKCYVDAGIDTTGNSNSQPTCDQVKTLQTCLMSLSTVCEGNYAYNQGKTSLQDVVTKCTGGDQCTVRFQKCYVDAGIDTTGNSNSQPTCDQVKTVQTCLIGLSTVCEGNYAYNQGKTSLQDVVTKCTGVDKCTGSLQKCYVEAGIDIDTTGDNTSDPTCEDAKTLQTCVMSLSTVCEGNYAYNQGKTSLQDVVAKCKGLQVFPSLVLILVAALLTFVTTF